MEILTCYEAFLHVQDTLSRNGQGEIGGVAVSMTFPAGVRHYSQASLQRQQTRCLYAIVSTGMSNR
jgi:hypothetical protein